MFLHVWESQVQNGFNWPKIKVSAGSCYSWRPQETTHSWGSEAFGGFLHFLAHGPSHFQSRKAQLSLPHVSSPWPLLSSHLLSLWPPNSLLHIEGPLPLQRRQMSNTIFSLHLMIFSVITATKFLWPCKVGHSQVPRTVLWTSLWSDCSAQRKKAYIFSL